MHEDMKAMIDEAPPAQTYRKGAVLLLSAVVVVPAAVVLFFLLTQKPESLSAGDRMRSIPATDLEGRSRTLRSNRDGEHLWLVVSASCPICRLELTELTNATENIDRVTIVSLSSLAETRELMRSFARLRECTVVDSSGAMERTYGKFRFPTALMLNGHGTVLQKWRGIAPTPLARIKFNAGVSALAQ